MTLKGIAKFKWNLTCGLKNDIRNLANFHANISKSGNLGFDWSRLSKAYKYLDEKVQKSYAWLHWRVIQSLNKKWLLVPKMTWGIWRILTWAVQSLKISTLLVYFCRKYIMFMLKRYRGVVLWKILYAFKNDIINLVNLHTSSSK